MSRYGGYGFAPYESVAEKKAKAKKKIIALRKKGQKVAPVEIEGRTIAKSWWGKAWNNNLTKYADFSNRLSRGKSYVTHGCVIDLQISKGSIKALIMGSGRSVYKANISINPLNKIQWAKIKKSASGNISSMADLLVGKFPKEMEELLSNKSAGLFPAPSEFFPQCDCPDYSKFCKHLAAVIYGIGNRLDSDPSLLFMLRGVDPKELIAKVVKERKDDFIYKAKHVKSKRIINVDNSKLSTMFDIKI